MNNDKLKILEMIQSGKLNASEGMVLLEALDVEEIQEKPQTILKGEIKNRFLKVKVDNAKSKVNVNIPLNLLRATSKLLNMGMGFIPEEARIEMEKKGIDLAKFDFDELVTLLDQGLVDGKLVEVDSDEEEGRTKVEIYVE